MLRQQIGFVNVGGSRIAYGSVGAGPLRERLAAVLAARRLDRELASGTSPATGAALSLRAEALGAPAVREALAVRLRRVLDDARRGRKPGRAQVPVVTSAVLAAAQELEALADRLQATGPVGAGGLAKLHLLLRDGSSPLYSSRARESLRNAAADALDALEPTFSW